MKEYIRCLSFSWNRVGILIMVIVVVLKVAWSAGLEGPVLNPLKRIFIIGFGMDLVVRVLPVWH